MRFGNVSASSIDTDSIITIRLVSVGGSWFEIKLVSFAGLSRLDTRTHCCHTLQLRLLQISRCF